ncbi:pseudouridine synthase [Veillonella intestinalis]|uniref:pseudouridine synthase n=1 Tax=Veillonella intestinalis TaxID=2941341 RepID=UPI0020419F67|nr:pseudouridine synthase [Veillonella intestinalis]
MRLRLDKFLVNKALGSRKEVHGLIKQGLVTVDGIVATKKDQAINIPEQVIAVNGEVIDSRQNYYVKLNKPAGYVCAVEDARHPTVMELLPPEFLTMGVVPVGRLDKDTEGLLLLSNDGVWAHRIINGKKHISKLYYIEYAGELTDTGLARIQEGIVLGDGTVCKPAILEVLEPGKAQISIEEGKYHQVKRMIGAAGGEVTYLRRLSVGHLTLAGIENLGDFAYLDEEDVEKL